MFGKNKKSKATPTLPPIDDVEYEEEEEEESDDEEGEEEYVEVRPKKKKKKVNLDSLPEIEPPTSEDEEELTEDKVKAILQNHEARLQKLEYHLRL